MTLRDLLLTRPPHDTVSEASRRARVAALRRLEERRPLRTKAPFISFACALTAALIFVLSLRTPPEHVPSPLPSPPLRMDLRLTDGTRVVWTFDDRFTLRGS